MPKVDVAKSGDPLNKKLIEQYSVKDVPTIVFLEAQGKERIDLRLADFLPPEPFLNRMADLKTAK